jgi:hypothetical protein
MGTNRNIKNIISQVLAILKFCSLDQFERTTYDFFIKKKEMTCPKCFKQCTFLSNGRGGNTKTIGIKTYQFKCSACSRKSQLPAILKENEREDILEIWLARTEKEPSKSSLQEALDTEKKALEETERTTFRTFPSMKCKLSRRRMPN